MLFRRRVPLQRTIGLRASGASSPTNFSCESSVVLTNFLLLCATISLNLRALESHDLTPEQSNQARIVQATFFKYIALLRLRDRESVRLLQLGGDVTPVDCYGHNFLEGATEAAQTDYEYQAELLRNLGTEVTLCIREAGGVTYYDSNNTEFENHVSAPVPEPAPAPAATEPPSSSSSSDGYCSPA